MRRMDQVEVRRAGPADAEELTRLRALMFEDMGRDMSRYDATWWQRNADHFAVRLLDREQFAAFVVDGGAAKLAASSVGWLNQHLIGAANPSGKTGYVANVATDPAHRRRGYARATMVALLAWLRHTGTAVVDLHATPDAEPLYRSLGFTEPTDRALTLKF
jgi:ribosomal protein S18 acetylase RimI-like enzyme